MKRILLALSTIALLSFYCADNKYSDIEKEKILQGLVVKNLTGTSGSGAITCSSSVTFSSLASAGLTSKCASCHGSSGAKGGVDVTSYSSVTAKVTTGNPESSVFYNSIKAGGSMAAYSDTTLNNAVYCWIKGGATQ